MEFFYDGQIRRYLVQIIRLFSNFTVKYSDGTLVRVPVVYGDPDRQAASIVNQNSENTVMGAPKIAVYITDLDLDRNRLGDATYVGKVHIRERDIETGEYTSTQGSQYTVERLMPTPFNLSIKVDIWSSSTEQKLQILEQILTFFNPSLEIQSTDNYLDWTSLTVVELEDVTFSSRSIPQGTNISIDIATLLLKTPIWLTPPAKVKKLGIVTNIIANIFGSVGEADPGYIDGLGVDVNAGTVDISQTVATEKVNCGNLGLIVTGNSVKLTANDGIGGYLNWRIILDQYPGKYRAGLSKIFLYQEDGSEVVGYVTLSPLANDETIMVANWDEDTYPTNDAITGPSRPSTGWGTFDAVVDPLNLGPNGSGLTPSAGTRYLIIDDIGDINNSDGPDAWKNSDNSDFVAEANDIIEWDGAQWHIVFSAKDNSENLIYQTNIYTLVQYKWNGISWVKSFEGEYARGEWRLEL
jgi:hypothetical protein